MTANRLVVRAGVVALVLGLVVALGACGSDDGKLKVTGLEPRSGDAMGGQLVLIKGHGFQKVTRNAKVYFGGEPGNVIRFRGDSELLVEAPGGKPGEVVDVLVVFEPGGELPIPKAFTFVSKDALDVGDLSHKKDKDKGK